MVKLKILSIKSAYFKLLNESLFIWIVTVIYNVRLKISVTHYCMPQAKLEGKDDDIQDCVGYVWIMMTGLGFVIQVL